MDYLEALLLNAVHTMPLEWFVLIASFIEEVFAPIPSLSVLLTTGALAAVQDRTVMALLPLVLLATLGKTVGAIGVYYLSEKAGTKVFTKLGRFFDVTPQAVEAFGEKINHSPHAFWLLTLFRALPVVPSSLVSISGGLLKVRLSMFVAATFIGTIVRDSIFIYIGYLGVEWWQAWAEQSADVESLVQLSFIVGVFGIGVYLLWKRWRRK